MAPLTSLSALQDAVNALPPVAPGKVRVFRGQTTDYPTITPASYRTRLASLPICLCYSRLLLKELRADHALPHLAGEELQVEALWQEAVAQHYASGSSYLDVTHSIESAAWFALHVGTWVPESSLPDAARPAWVSELKHEIKWLEYSRAAELGYIYAFDVEKWDSPQPGSVLPDIDKLLQSGLVPPDLALVDLSNAPDPFKTPRMLAQLGCLIRTGESERYDLRPLRVKGTPLQIAWPMTGSEVVKRTVEEMFPGPAVDPWYERFLIAPMMLDVDAATGKLVLRRPLPVTLYRGETDAYNAALTATEWILSPPLLHDFLRHPPARADASKTAPLRELETREVMSKAMSVTTPIVLEAPVLSLFPPPTSNLWNHQLLLSDISSSVAAYSDAMQEIGNVSLLNVLFQFSQLEETFWERARTSNETHKLTRGLWLSGSQKEWILARLMLQEFPGMQVEIQPPVKIRLDPVKRRFIYERFEGDTEWAELSTVPELAKPVFVALYLLRALSPRLKVEATPNAYRMMSGEEHGATAKNRYSFSAFANAARLVRIKGPQEVPDWFFLRTKQNDPFTTVADAGSPSFLIDTPAAFADLTANDLIAAARS
jgi:hypothetical protein